MAGASGECREASAAALRHVPSAAVMAAALASGLSTGLPGILANMGVVTLGEAFRAFLFLYFLTLPLVAVVSRGLYLYASRLARYCGTVADAAPFIIGVLPLGFIISLFYTQSLLLGGCDVLRKRLGRAAAVVTRTGGVLDLLVNLLLLGLYVIVYAASFNSFVDAVSAVLCAEQEGAA